MQFGDYVNVSQLKFLHLSESAEVCFESFFFLLLGDCVSIDFDTTLSQTNEQFDVKVFQSSLPKYFLVSNEPMNLFCSKPLKKEFLF